MPRQANAAVMSASTILVLARSVTLPARAGLSIGERIVLTSSAASAFATLVYMVWLVIIFW